MQHLNAMSALNIDISADFQIRATGKYYTHEKIAGYMISILLPKLAQSKPTSERLKIADPFAGDGRLIIWFIEAWLKLELPRIHWDVYLFDIEEDGLRIAASRLDSLRMKGVSLTYTIIPGDSFKISMPYKNVFDVVITNPPWELLKPDTRELKELTEDAKDAYIKSMKSYDIYLGQEYPLSQPLRKFAGWGTNLSRVGAELSYNVCKEDGYSAIVLPASFFADDLSVNIREKILSTSTIYDIAYYPAEARLFGKADVASSSLIFRKSSHLLKELKITVFDKLFAITSSDVIKLKSDGDRDTMIPLTLGGNAIQLLKKMRKGLPNWGQLEDSDSQLWAGREMDETGSRNWLSSSGNGPKFIKGRMIDRFRIVEEPHLYVNKENCPCPNSCNFDRIAWRDVSRASQKRRVIATVVPKGTIAGNSLGIAYFKDGDKNSLYALLAIMSSLCFELQLRCYLATGHISLSAVRKVHVPPRRILNNLSHLIQLVSEALSTKASFVPEIEAVVARDIYGLNRSELVLLMNVFDKLTELEKEEILIHFDSISSSKCV